MPSEISVLISELSNPDAALRSSAAEALSQLGEEASAAAVPLVRAAGDESEEVKEWAVAALEEMGAPSATDVDAVIELLSHETPDVAYWAATLVGRLRADAVAAVPALCNAVGAERPLMVRERAAWALGRIGPAAGANAIAALKKAAADSEPRLSRLAQRALEQVSQ